MLPGMATPKQSTSVSHPLHGPEYRLLRTLSYRARASERHASRLFIQKRLISIPCLLKA
ncbi:hypothetical protein ACVWYH_005407 [Bradyrhizobium sp. GM24.11]